MADVKALRGLYLPPESAATSNVVEMPRRTTAEPENAPTSDIGDAPNVMLPRVPDTADDHPRAEGSAVGVDMRPATPDDGEEFWTARPELTHIRAFARARMAGPYSTLAVVLARAVCSIEPTTQLPPTIGKNASLNFFVALVGRSGAGKGASEGAGRDAVKFLNEQADLIAAESFPIGTGQGLRAAYMRAPDKDEVEQYPTGVQVRTCCMFTAPEIDSLTALGQTPGSVLMPELRKLYSGEELGQGNATREARVIVPEHSYRAVLIAGVQPGRGRALLDDSDGGTPQRFLWVPVTDRGAPDITPECPEPLEISITRRGKTVVAVPESVVAPLKEIRLRMLRDDPRVDPLDGHRGLTRLKVAFAFAVLAGRSSRVTEDDWELAGHLMQVSDRTRGQIESVLQEQGRAANYARAHSEADRAEVLEQRKLEREQARVKKSVTVKLARGQWVSRGELNRALKSDIRPHVDTVLADLESEGAIESRDEANRREYRSRRGDQ
ncbi:hypothetical protein [Nocardia sp. NPDC004711]